MAFKSDVILGSVYNPITRSPRVLTGTDTLSLAESTTATPTSLVRDAAHGLLSNDSGVVGGIVSFKLGLPGMPGATGQFGTRLRGSFGDLVLNRDGSYSYVANNVEQLNQGEVVHDYFSYTVRGADGTLKSEIVDFGVTGTNDAPIIFDPAGRTSISLSEEGLVGGLADTQGTSDTTNSTVFSTEITIGDPDYCDGLTLSIVPPAGLMAGGQALVWVNVGNAATGAVMVGRVGSASGPDALRISCDLGGHLEVRLLRPVTHPDSTAEDVVTDRFSVVVTDTAGAHSALDLELKLEDDSPVAALISRDILDPSRAFSGALFDGINTAMGADGGGVAALIVGGVLYDRTTPAYDPTTGILTVTNSAGDTIAMNLQTGAYTFTANPVSTTADRTETISYFLLDQDGDMANANLVFNLKAISPNRAPVAVKDENAVLEGNGSTETTASGDVTPTGGSQDYDPDGDAFSVTGVAIGNASAAPLGNVGVQLDGVYGRITLQADGSYGYRLDNTRAATNGLAAGVTATEVITYTISDARNGVSFTTLTIKITGTNDGPTAVADNNSIVEGTGTSNTSVTGDLTPSSGAGRDTDPDTTDVLSVASIGAGTSTGSSTSAMGTYGTVAVGSNGSYTYTLNGSGSAQTLAAGQTANDVFTYVINDGHGGTSATTLTIKITGTNDAPTAVADSANITEGTGTSSTSVTGDLTPSSGAGMDTDPDAGDVISVTSIGAGTSTGSSTSATGTYGTVTVGSNGSYTYTLNGSGSAQTLAAGQTANDVFTYVINDGKGGTSATALTIKITGTNDGPTAVADSANITEGTGTTNTTVSGDLTPGGTGQDSDPDGNVLSVTSIGAGSSTGSSTSATGAYGTITVGSGGNYSYVLNGSGAANALAAGQTATELFTYVINDGAGGTSATTLTIKITGTADNGAPTAVADNANITEGTGTSSTSVTGDLTPTSGAGMDTDPDTTDVLSVTSIGAGTSSGSSTSATGTYGTVTVGSNGSYTYTLTGTGSAQTLGVGQTANDVFTYVINDGHGGTSATTLSIKITGTNDKPTAVADEAHVTEGTGTSNVTITGDVTPVSGPGRDSDPDSTDVLSVIAVGGGNNGTYGTLSLLRDGSYTYILKATGGSQSLAVGQTATDVFTYVISDGQGGQSSTTLTIWITGTNDGPTAVADTANITEGTGTTSTTVSGDLTPGSAGQDSDPDGNVLSVTSIGAGTSTGSSTSATGTYGTITVGSDGNYRYVLNGTGAANALAAGQTATELFTYVINDGASGTSATTLTIKITGTADSTNSAPSAVADNANITEGTGTISTSVTGDLTPTSGAGMDTDPDAGDVISVTSIGAGTSTGSSTSATGTYGTVTVGSNGNYTYTLTGTGSAQTLAAGQTANDVFTYVINDGKGGTSATTLTIKVTGTNDGPTAVADTANITEGTGTTNTTVSGDLTPGGTGQDSDPDGNVLSVTSIGAGSSTGSSTSATGAYGTITVGSGGNYSYVLNGSGAANALAAGQTATELFTYVINDGAGGTSATTLTIKITGTADNGAPTAVADNANITEGTGTSSTSVTGDLTPASGAGMDTDPDAGDVISVTSIGAGTSTGSSTSATGTYGTVTVGSNGSYSYTLNGSGSAQALAAGQTANDVFTYVINDGHGGTSATTLTIKITGTNDAPTAVANTGTVNEFNDNGNGEWLVLNVLANDSDPDGGSSANLEVTGISAPFIGLYDGFNWYESSYGYVLSKANGELQYVTYPATVGTAGAAVNALAVGQTLVDTVTYTIRDAAGATSSTTLTITIKGQNDGPVAVADYGTVNEYNGNGNNEWLSGVNVLSNDTDPDNGDKAGLLVSGISAPYAFDSGGLPWYATSYGYISYNAAGNISYRTYTRDEGSAGATVHALAVGQTLVDTITYTIRDTSGATSTTTLSITIKGQNDGPVAVADYGTVNEYNGNGNDEWLSGVNVLSNDTDPDNGDKAGLLVSGISAPYAFDSGGLRWYATSYGYISYNAAGNIAYRTYTKDEGTAGATVHALAVGQTLVDTITYTIRDTSGATSTTTLSITIKGQNDGPVAVADYGTVNEYNGNGNNEWLSGVNVLSNDTDPDNGDKAGLLVSGISAPYAFDSGGLRWYATSYGYISYNATGNIAYRTYTKDEGTAGATVHALAVGQTLVDTITYTIRDTSGATSTTTLSITIKGQNDGPVAVADYGTVNEYNGNGNNEWLSGVNVLSNDTDPDNGDKAGLLVSGISAPYAFDSGGLHWYATSYGYISYNAAGNISYRTYTRDEGSAGATVHALAVGQTLVDTITYTIRDTSGATSTTTLSITIKGQNDGPVAVADRAGISDTDGTANVTISGDVTPTSGAGMDFDPDNGDMVSVVGIGAGTGIPALNTSATSLYGSISINSAGNYSYVLNGTGPASALGVGVTATDVFTYVINDGHGGTSATTLTITITGCCMPTADDEEPEPTAPVEGGQIARTVTNPGLPIEVTADAWLQNGGHLRPGTTLAAVKILGTGFFYDSGCQSAVAPNTRVVFADLMYDLGRSSLYFKPSAAARDASGHYVTGFLVEDSLGLVDASSNNFVNITVQTPLVLDLNGDGVQTLQQDARVRFDMDGDGKQEGVGWVSAADGLLVRDLDGDGQISSGRELFGNYTRQADGSLADNGFAALSDLDADHNGVFSLDDAAWKEVQVWQDANSNGHVDAGEILSLDQAGVASIKLDYHEDNQGQGLNNLWLGGEYTDTSGKLHQMADVVFGASDLAARQVNLDGSSTWHFEPGKTQVVDHFDAHKDVLDLRDLLGGHGESLDQYLHVHQEGANTVIEVDAADHSQVESKVVLEHVDLFGDCRDEQQIIQSLLHKPLPDA